MTQQPLQTRILCEGRLCEHRQAFQPQALKYALCPGRWSLTSSGCRLRPRYRSYTLVCMPRRIQSSQLYSHWETALLASHEALWWTPLTSCHGFLVWFLEESSAPDIALWTCLRLGCNVLSDTINISLTVLLLQWKRLYPAYGREPHFPPDSWQ